MLRLRFLFFVRSLVIPRKANVVLPSSLCPVDYLELVARTREARVEWRGEGGKEEMSTDKPAAAPRVRFPGKRGGRERERERQTSAFDETHVG